MSVTTSPRLTLADSLLKEGTISRSQYERAVQEYEQTKRSLVRILTDMGALNDDARMKVLQKNFNYEVVRLKDVVPRADVVGFVSRDLCRRHHLVPLRIEENSVLVAMEDPSDVRVIEDVEKLFGRNVKVVLASSDEILETVERLPELSHGGAMTSEAPHGTGYKVIASLSLLALALIPMALSYYFIFYTATGADWYAGFQFETFETMLVLMIAWGSWAAIAYFFNDLIFGERSNS